MSEFRTCRYCNKMERGLIKYALRAYAHGRCLLRCWVPDRATTPVAGALPVWTFRRERSMRVLEALPTVYLGQFRLSDFDRVGDKLSNAVGLTVDEFVSYVDQRRAADLARIEATR